MIVISKIENGFLVTVGNKQYVAMSRWRQLSTIIRTALRELEKQSGQHNESNKTHIRQQKLTAEK
jgi:hypothetical protein